MKKIIFLSIIASFFLQVNAQQKGNDCLTAIPYGINLDPVGGFISNGEIWWYSFSLAADYQNVEIRTCLSTADAACIVDLYSDCSTFIIGGAPNTCNPGNPNEMISLPTLQAGTYYVKVTGGGLSNGAYTLEIIGTTDAVFDDLSVIDITKPVKNFSTGMPVTIYISNLGQNSQTGFPVSYNLNGNTVNETCFMTIASGETVNYTFLQTMDLSIDAINNISATTELANDENTSNDEFSTNINSFTGDNAIFSLYSDYIQVPNNEAFNFTGNFTIEAWFYSNSTKGNEDIISKHANDGTNKSGYALEYNGTNVTAVIGTGSNWLTASLPAVKDQWYHIALIYNNSELTLMVNEVSTSGTSGVMLQNTNDLYICGSQQYGNYLTGYIDEVRIWNIARAEQEIQNNMNHEIDPNTTGLVAYYQFNQGIPNGDNTDIEYLADMTDNNFHGKLYNFTLAAGNSDHNFFSTCDLDLVEPKPDIDVLQDITAECSTTVTIIPTATDNCAGTITGTTTDDLFYDVQGTYTITWNFDDGNGNSIDVDQTVIIEDVTNPTISCIGNQTINLNEGETFYTVSGTEFDPTTSDDNCGVASVTNNINSNATLSGAEFPIGVNSITWTVTDNAGNTADCSFDVTVNAFNGIADLYANGISSYPNPTTGVFYLSDNSLTIQNIKITDITGKTIQSFSGSQIDISHFQNGIYFLKIETEKGVFVEKIIKN